MEKYKQLYQNEKFAKIEDPDGIWSYDKDNQLLKRRKIPGTDQIGDLRVTFECLSGFGSRQGPRSVAIGT